jgi:nitronate monooxygenase
MYPCSNPELVGAVSAAGGLGIIQPLSLVYVHKLEFRRGLRLINLFANGKPVGLNLIVEKSSKVYEDRMRKWLEIALEENIRFFVTSLGSPKWVVDRVQREGAIVYHDVTNRKWAEKAVDAGVHGLIAVNSSAGGHAGSRTAQQLFDDIAILGVPILAAGGISTAQDFLRVIRLGYAGAQLGTRFIATSECKVHPDYKKAIVEANENDIVLTEKISGIPVSVINTPYVQQVGTKVGTVARFLLKQPRTKHYVRMFYSLQSLWRLKRSSQVGSSYEDYWQAGKSVAGIHSICSAADVVSEFAAISQT